MSEPIVNEAMPNVEQESGPVRRVAERVGKFLSENYTLKGAKAKELRAMDKTIAKFTPSQQKELRSYFDDKAERNARWKVIRNWVATGAGLAVAGWVGVVGPEQAWMLLKDVGGAVAKWAGGIATGIGEGLRNMGSAIGTGLTSIDAAVNDYLFDMNSRPRLVGDAPVQDWKIVTDLQQTWENAPARKVLEETGAGYERAWNEGIKPFFTRIGDAVAKGPNLQRWTVYFRP